MAKKPNHTMTISLPAPMLMQLEKVRKEEQRTQSEVMREALRHYFDNRYPVVTATKVELGNIRRGRAEVEAGQFVSLEQLRNELATTNRRPRAKSAPKASR